MKVEVTPPTEPDVEITVPLSVANRLAILLGFVVDPTLNDLYDALDEALGELPMDIPEVTAEVYDRTHVLTGNLSRIFFD